MTAMTSTNMIVKSSSGLAVNDGPSVLGEQAARIPIGGKIRPGIKVLTSKARQNQKAVEIYDAGVARGSKWAVIEKQIKDQCNIDYPTTPRNVQYFSVFRADFTNPAAADQIMDLYGEDQGGERRLLRFPVIFPTDYWQTNIPNKLECHTRSGLLYWSDYDPAGNRRCFTRKPVEVDNRSKRAARPFGGRPAIPRPDTNGVCNPEVCPQYQNNECNLKGSILFYIPGIPGGAAISLPLGSFYAMEQARETMSMVSYLRGGRISGTHQGKPIFYITKKQQDVSMLDRQTGLPKRVPHWIVTLEADIDMLQVFQAAEQRVIEHQAQDAAMALSGPEIDEPVHDDDDGEGAIEGEYIPEDPALADDLADEREVIKALRAQVADLCEEVGVKPQLFSNWMVQETDNPDWGKTLNTLETAKGHLQHALNTGPKEWLEENGLDVPF